MPFTEVFDNANATTRTAEAMLRDYNDQQEQIEREMLETHLEIQAAVKAGYGLAVHDLEAAASGLRSFTRAAICKEALPGLIAEAREALARAEAALS